MSAIIYPSWTPQTGHPVTQVGHGFTLGQQISFDGPTWLLASAASVQTLRVATVGQVVSADQFLAVFEGVLTWPAHGFTLGAVYYLSDSVIWCGCWSSSSPSHRWDPHPPRGR